MKQISTADLSLIKLKLTAIKSDLDKLKQKNEEFIQNSKDLPFSYIKVSLSNSKSKFVIVDDSFKIIERLIRDSIEVKFSKRGLNPKNKWEDYCEYDRTIYREIYKYILLHFEKSNLISGNSVIKLNDINKNLIAFTLLPKLGFITILYDVFDNQPHLCLVHLPSIDEIDEIIFQVFLSKSDRLFTEFNNSHLYLEDRKEKWKQISIYQNILHYSKSEYFEYLNSDSQPSCLQSLKVNLSDGTFQSVNTGSANTKIFLAYIFYNKNIMDIAKQEGKELSAYLRENYLYNISDYSQNNSIKDFEYLNYSKIKSPSGRVNDKLKRLIRKSYKDYLRFPDLYIDQSHLRPFLNKENISREILIDSIFHIAVKSKFEDYQKDEIFS